MGQYLRAVNYLTAAQIFLADNHLMKRPIGFDDVKSRLLGHWGSGPGINFAYAHLSRFAKKYDHDMMSVSYTHLDVYKRQLKILIASPLFVIE